MAKRWYSQAYQGMTTLNTGFSTEIKANELSDSMNMVRNEGGLWENRKGIVQFGEGVGSGEPIHSLAFWKTKAGARHLTVGTDTDVYSYAESASYNDGAFTNRTTLGTANKWDLITYRDIAVLGNGVDDLESSTDNATWTTRTAGASIVKAKFLEVGNDFVWFGGDKSSVESEDTIYLSSGAPTNPWEYDNSNILRVDVGNSDTVSGILSLGQNLIVTKSRRTYAVDLAGLTRQTLDFGGGCESNRSILRTQKNSVFIAGKQGVFDISKSQIGSNVLSGKPESNPIKDIYDLISDYSDINGLYTFGDNWALWNAPTSIGRLTFLRDLDYSESVWTYLVGVNATDWTIYEDSDGVNHYLYADGATDKVWELFKGRNDNGAPILSRLSGKRDDFGSPGGQKMVEYIDFYGYISTNAKWKIKLYKDDNQNTPLSVEQIDSKHIQTDTKLNGLGVNALGTVPLGGKLAEGNGDLPVKPFHIRVPINTTLEKLQWALENNQADARVIFRAAVVKYQLQEDDLYPPNNIA